MKKAISVNKKSSRHPKKRGDYHVTGLKLSPRLGVAVDKWASSQDDVPTRAEAIRRLVEIGLTAKARPTQGSRARSETASAMASDQLDRLVDQSASAEQQANRKRRLLKGPEEFQSVRVDRVKK
jgi:hypothetical protein